MSKQTAFRQLLARWQRTNVINAARYVRKIGHLKQTIAVSVAE